MIRSAGLGFKSSPRYHRGNPNRISSFFMVAGGGLVSSVIYTIPPNLPLIREACGKAFALHCLAIVYPCNTELHACNPQ